MTANRFRRIALGMNGSVEGAHMGHPDFRVHGRIFATLHGDGQHGMVKLTPEQQERFVRDDGDGFVPESGAWGRQGCTRVRLASVDLERLGEAMTLAWQNVVQAAASRSSRATRTRDASGPDKPPHVEPERRNRGRVARRPRSRR